MDIHRIEEIYRTSFNKYEDLYDYFLNYCGFQILITRLSLGYNTYRVRDYKDLNEIKNMDNVKYPPTSRSYSRIGKPDQIWFYVSDDFYASLSEMLPSWYSKVNQGDDINIVISSWHVRKEIKVMIIPDLNNINEVCKEIDLEAYHNKLEFWTYISNKLRTTTLESKDIYQFTSAFTNSLMYRANLEEMGIEGIFYPSVQYPSKSNLALLPSTVDKEKIIFRSLTKTTIRKSKVLDSQGMPKYQQICKYEQGYYEPDKDIISWELE